LQQTRRFSVKGIAGGGVANQFDSMIWHRERPQPLQVFVVAPSMCAIKPWAYASFKSGIPATQYHLTIDHPR
jgi:hypothetical protein